MEGEGAREVGPGREFFTDAEFPFVDRFVEGEEFSNHF